MMSLPPSDPRLFQAYTILNDKQHYVGYAVKHYTDTTSKLGFNLRFAAWTFLISVNCFSRSRQQKMTDS